MTKGTNRKKRSKLTIILLAPILALTFMVGWSLYWIGNRQHKQPHLSASKINAKQDTVQLMVIPGQEEQEITNN